MGDRADGSAPTADIGIHDLATRWPESHGAPLELFTMDDPAVQAGSYVIEPGERVPETGTTSHDGPELSVILSGEVVLGVPDADRETTVSAESFVTIPAGLEHYSRNDGNDPVELVYVVLGAL